MKRLAEIFEGKARISVPDVERKQKGPGSKTPIFYNPAMEFNRDISMLVLQTFVKVRGRHIDVLDGLAGTGIRGIRFCREVRGDFSVTINDWNKEAFAIIQKNIERNNVHAIPSNRNLNTLLCDCSFDYIDIDPFGTPVPFIDNAVRGIRHKGIIGITATDTAALCGASRKACIRRYDAIPMHCEFMHEIGLRILLGYAVRTAAKYDRAIFPLLCYAEGHYMRVYFSVLDGARKADRQIEGIGYANYCKCGRRWMSSEPEECCRAIAHAGPLWTGEIFDKNFLGNMKDPKEIREKKNVSRFISLWLEEADVPLYYTIPEVSRRFEINPPPMSRVLGLLRNSGFTASRTHFDPAGFRTDAPFDALKKILRQKPKQPQTGL